MSYPTKCRERTIEYRNAGHTLEETHQTFRVSIATIRKWEKQLEEEGNLEKKPLHRSYKKINPEKLIVYVAEHPDAYQKEITEELGCSATAICLAMKRLKITCKKDNGVPGAGRKKVAVYQAEIRSYPIEKIAYVDECRIDTYLYREYGYAARGQKVFSRISGHKYKRCGIVAAQVNGSVCRKP